MGFIFDNFGIRTDFLLGAFFSVVSIIILLRIKEKNVHESNNLSYFNVTPYKNLLRNREIIAILVTVFLYFFGLTTFSSLFAVYFIEIGGTTTLLGISHSIMSIIVLIISTPAGIFADKRGRKDIAFSGNPAQTTQGLPPRMWWRRTLPRRALIATRLVERNLWSWSGIGERSMGG